jgi:tetratricopeptide (TPR) repeat protein
MNAICLALMLVAMPRSVEIVRAPAIDKAFNRLYNFDFPGMFSVLDEYSRTHPDDPMAYAAHSVGYLFYELHRMDILATEFFTDDEKVTDRNRLKPDLVVRAKLFQMTQEAKKKAEKILALNPNDRNAMAAICTASEVETDYTILIEKRYLRSFSLSREAQKHARRLLAMDPPEADAHLTFGMVEYVVSNMNWFFRIFVRFNQIEGSKQKAIENLKEVIKDGHYYVPLAKILLSVVYLREKMPHQALILMQELERDFPENSLIRNEVRKIAEQINKTTAARN